MDKRIIWLCLGFACLGLLWAHQGVAQDDRVAQVAMETVRAQSRLPKETEIKFVEKRESQIPDFYAVKLLLVFPDREVPVLVYVDKAGEKVILGQLLIKGENVTRKEAGTPKPRKIDLGGLGLEKAPFRGARTLE